MSHRRNAAVNKPEAASVAGCACKCGKRLWGFRSRSASASWRSSLSARVANGSGDDKIIARSGALEDSGTRIRTSESCIAQKCFGAACGRGARPDPSERLMGDESKVAAWQGREQIHAASSGGSRARATTTVIRGLEHCGQTETSRPVSARSCSRQQDNRKTGGGRLR